MANYSSKNNKGSVSQFDAMFTLVFFVAVIAFLVLPLMQNPLQNIWRSISLSTLSAGIRSIAPFEPGECAVIGTPPVQAFDTLLLECAPGAVDRHDFVWYREGTDRYLVGYVTYVSGGRVTASLYSSANTWSLPVRIGASPERFSAISLGAGVFRVEVPAEVDSPNGAQVRHAVSGQLLGLVTDSRIERGSYIKRIYIRLPFSFERLQRLYVE